MKTSKTGMTLLSGMLMAAPAFAQLAGVPADVVRVSENSGRLFASEALIAQGQLGFTRKVLIAVRIVKNGNTGSTGLSCYTAHVPDSVTIEILDPETKKVLAISRRLFGEIEVGVNMLKQSRSSECRDMGLELNMTEGAVTLVERNNISTTLDIGGIASVVMPAKLILRRVSQR